MTLHQDADFFLGRFSRANEVEHQVGKNHRVYVYVITGSVSLEGTPLSTGDAAEVSEVSSLSIEAQKGSSVFFIELEG